MNRFSKLLVLAFFLLAPPRIAWCLLDDFGHPERWSDPRHNLYFSLLLLGLFLLGAVALGIWLWVVTRRDRRQRAAAPPSGAHHA